MELKLQFKTGKKRGPQELVSVDFDPTGTRCVRLRKSNDEVHLLAADILPAVDLTANSDPSAVIERSLTLPKHLVARYVCVCVPGPSAIVKLLNIPGQMDSDMNAKIREHMGVPEGGTSTRLAFRVISQGHGRGETKMLTVDVPEFEIKSALAQFPVGIPAPFSVELSGLAAMTTFLHGPGKTHGGEAVGVIEQGARVTYVSFFNKGELVLIRKFEVGTFNVLEKIQQNLGVDRETAQDIISDGSFDVSQIVKDVMEPFVKQLVISKHFVERRENCRIARIFVPGGVGTSHDWLNEIKVAVGLDVDFWNPFDAVHVAEGVLASEYDGQLSQFAAAIGGGLGTFEGET